MAQPPIEASELARTITAVEAAGGNITAAAIALGIPRTTVASRVTMAKIQGMDVPKTGTIAPNLGQQDKKILLIPDTQARPGDDLSFLECVSKYIEDKKPQIVVHLGDLADMQSLSLYDVGKKQFEGRRYKADIESAIEANERLWCHVTYDPERHIFVGNHEHRIVRAVDSDPKLDGTMGLEDLQYERFYKHVHPFLTVKKIAGIAFSHYFYNPNSGKPYGGTAHTKLKNVGMSFCMGHQQGLDVAMRELPDGTQQIGIVAGSCYEHNEEYRGPQANGHWRGVVMLHECDGSGRADPMFVSLNYLRKRYS